MNKKQQEAFDRVKAIIVREQALSSHTMTLEEWKEVLREVWAHCEEERAML
jgi:hypothetical protein